MPFIRQYALFQYIRIPANLKHIDIVIGFYKKCGYSRKTFDHSVRIYTEIRTHSDGTVTVLDPVCHRLKSIMADFYRFYKQILYRKIIIRGYLVKERHIKRAETFLLHDSLYSALCGIHRYSVFT